VKSKQNRSGPLREFNLIVEMRIELNRGAPGGTGFKQVRGQRTVRLADGCNLVRA